MQKAINYKIPKDLDKLPVVLFWEVDEFGMLVASMFIGLIIRHAIITVGLTFILIMYYRRLKQKKHKGFIMHFLYKIGVMTPPNIPPYHIKEFTD